MPRLFYVFPLLLVACAGPAGDFADVRTTLRAHAALDAPLGEEPTASDRVPSPLGPRDAVRLALVYNRDLAAQLEDLGVARGALVAASLPQNPVLAGAYRVHSGQSDRIDASAMVDLADVWRIPMRRSAAEADLSGAHARAAADVLELVFQVRLAFYDYQASVEALSLRRRVVEALGAARDQARALFAAGNVPESDVSARELLFEEASVGVMEQERRVAARRERLAAAIGLLDPRQISVAQELDAPDDAAPTEDAAVAQAVSRSLELEASRDTQDAWSRRAGVARMDALLPTIAVGVDAAREEGGAWGVGPAAVVRVPLFDQGEGAVASADAEARRARDSGQALHVRVRAATRAALEAVVVERDRAKHYRDTIVPLHERHLALVRQNVNAMGASVFDLLAAQRDAIATRLADVEARRRYWRARAALDALMAGHLVDATTVDDEELPETTTATEVEVR